MKKIIKKHAEIVFDRNIFAKKRMGRFALFMDKFSFPVVLGLWLFLILIFALVYFFFSNGQAYLYYVPKQGPVDNLYDSIYFSFVAATTTGFGDIVPYGWFQIIAVLEVISGLLVLAFVTSKLVSIKQDAILNEVYEISFNERINRLRSSLVLFRQSVDRVIGKIEESTLRARDISSISVALVSFEDTLLEITSLVSKNGGREFIKDLDPLRAELIFNSVNNSFSKIEEFFSLCSSKKVNWEKELDASLAKQVLSLYDKIFSSMVSSSVLPQQKSLDLLQTKNSISDSIKKLL